MPSILIDIARRRQKPGSGSILEAIKPHPTHMFDHILSVPYALIGNSF